MSDITSFLHCYLQTRIIIPNKVTAFSRTIIFAPNKVRPFNFQHLHLLPSMAAAEKCQSQLLDITQCILLRYRQKWWADVSSFFTWQCLAVRSGNLSNLLRCCMETSWQQVFKQFPNFWKFFTKKIFWNFVFNGSRAPCISIVSFPDRKSGERTQRNDHKCTTCLEWRDAAWFTFNAWRG